MSESGAETTEEDRLEQVRATDPDPGLVDATGPEPAPVSAEQLAAGRDAVPADVAEEGDVQRLAQASHDDAGPEQEQPE